MKARVALAVVAALVLGAAGGWAVAASYDDDTRQPSLAVAELTPVPASPSLPVEEVQPDPSDPPLEDGIDLRTDELVLPGEGTEPDSVLTLPVPVGWQRSDGINTWGYTVPGNSENSYKLRVEIIVAVSETVEKALGRRVAEYESAEAQGNMTDVEIEINSTEDGFAATFIDVGGYRRAALERFYPGPDGQAFATVAATGRLQDERGLADLISRITRDIQETQRP